MSQRVTGERENTIKAIGNKTSIRFQFMSLTMGNLMLLSCSWMGRKGNRKSCFAIYFLPFDVGGFREKEGKAF